jgi:hypothetical protein
MALKHMTSLKQNNRLVQKGAGYMTTEQMLKHILNTFITRMKNQLSLDRNGLSTIVEMIDRWNQ